MSNIGLLNEKPLHASLKRWYARPGDRFEVPVDGYVIDIVRDDMLLEIQTGNFASIKAKLTALVRSHPIRLIYPIAVEKWIVKSEPGANCARRRSPLKGRLEDLFWEMVRFPHLLSHRNFSLEVLLIKEEEARQFDGKRNWRRRGWVTEERRLLEVVDRRLLASPADWRAILPEGIQSFTARDLADALSIPVTLAQKMAYSLQRGTVVTLLGRRGRAYLYGVPDDTQYKDMCASCHWNGPGLKYLRSLSQGKTT